MGLVEKVFVGVGSNLGDRESAIEQAIQSIAALPETELICCASLFESTPMGVKDQPDFLNSVIEIVTSLDPKRLLICLKQIEQALGRKERERWGPREIDLDILVFGDRIIDEVDLQIPHPQIARRLFVLRPLAELAPEMNMPGYSSSIQDLLDRLKDERGVEPFLKRLKPKQSQNPSPR